MSIKKKITTKPLSCNQTNKPNTITRAGITANLKYTRGKQLVEHSPYFLIPDPHNPRPGEIIDESWLKRYLYIGTEKSLCGILDDTGVYHIPEYTQIDCERNENIEESYNFLRDLAFSIRNDGLIEPIEIFLADRNNDSDYFVQSNLEYGYVILEGHQRRLAAMMAGVPTVTCIEITDESMLMKLKVKHRKLRRQLSENNLRKGLTVAQNFLMVKELLSDSEGIKLTNKELSNIIGLNEGIVSALKSICLNPTDYPPKFMSQLNENKLTFKRIRFLVPKTYKEIESELNNEVLPKDTIEKKIKPRGKQGGASKKYATFQIRDQDESTSLRRLLLTRFPEINYTTNDQNSFKDLESILNKIKEIALKTRV